MDLLNMITGLLTSNSSVDALSAKTGTDSSQTKGILSAALPMLFGALTDNASSEAGASSLLGALSQHTNTARIEEQISNADAEDGSKIIAHILGKKQSEVVKAISAKTGSDEKQVSALLSNVAPGMMSTISAAATAAKAQQKKAIKVGQAAIKVDSAARAQKAAVKAAEDAKAAKDAAIAKAAEAKASGEKAAAGLDLTGLLGGLLGGGSSKEESSGGLGSLLGGLLGGGSDSKEDDAADNPLLGMLKTFLK